MLLSTKAEKERSFYSLMTLPSKPTTLQTRAQICENFLKSGNYLTFIKRLFSLYYRKYNDDLNVVLCGARPFKAILAILRIIRIAVGP
jgi:hypothetical protein